MPEGLGTGYSFIGIVPDLGQLNMVDEGMISWRQSLSGILSYLCALGPEENSQESLSS